MGIPYIVVVLIRHKNGCYKGERQIFPDEATEDRRRKTEDGRGTIADELAREL